MSYMLIRDLKKDRGAKNGSNHKIESESLDIG
jgi:hypothetical protein